MENKIQENFENKLFFNKYKIEVKLGEGSFGKIYSCENITTNEKFAMKIESRIKGQNLLETEASIITYLKGDGIPAALSFGFSGDYNILIMELLGKSLEDIFQSNGRRFKLRTVCLLADQFIQRLEYIHSKHIIHRDLKPDNFLVGRSKNSNVIYLIDFGLAKKYRSSRTLQHCTFRKHYKLTGTARYASVNALKGYEQSRRDDLESVGYCLIYFLKGSLPWQGLKVHKNEDRYKKIAEKKETILISDLCHNLPNEFCEYLEYTRKLEFTQDPDYNYLRGLFKNVMVRFGLKYDDEFEWNTKNSSNLTNLSFENTAKNVSKLNLSAENFNSQTGEEVIINKIKVIKSNSPNIGKLNNSIDLDNTNLATYGDFSLTNSPIRTNLAKEKLNLTEVEKMVLKEEIKKKKKKCLIT